MTVGPASGTPHRQLPVEKRGGLVTHRSGLVTSGGDRVADGGRLDARVRALLALLGAAVAQVPRVIVHSEVTAVLEATIARGLVPVGSGLV